VLASLTADLVNDHGIHRSNTTLRCRVEAAEQCDASEATFALAATVWGEGIPPEPKDACEQSKGYMYKVGR